MDIAVCRRQEHRLTANRYGDEKGACENIFSYGFLEDTMQTARAMFLDLYIPDDDPLRPAKMFVNTAAPGFRLFEQGDTIGWDSDFVWLVVINEEDGLDFKLRQTTDGQREVQGFWKELELHDTSKIRDHLQQEPLWDVYQLRAIVLLQGRVDAQLHMLQEAGDPQRNSTIREQPFRLAKRLRSLESDMLQKTKRELELQVSLRSFLHWLPDFQYQYTRNPAHRLGSMPSKASLIWPFAIRKRDSSNLRPSNVI
jgi:hypothetical protein